MTKRANPFTALEDTLAARSIHGGETLTKAELDTLWEQANAALHASSLSKAFNAVEALLVQADCRHNVCADMLPMPGRTALAAKYSPEMLQSLTDRVESLNWAVRHCR